MAFVLDASVVAAWLMPDERNAVAEASHGLIAREDAIAPSIWWFEIRNMLIVNERRGRLRESETAAILNVLAGLQVVIDRDVGEKSLLRLARSHQLTVYDAAYLELACRRGLRLATLDKALALAARVEGVALIGDGAA